jgi:intraflagellar transport protein 80
MVVQSAKHFLLLDVTNGLIIYNYDGKNLSTVKLAGKYEFLTKRRVSLSPDYLAIIENNNRSIKFYDLTTGKALPFQIDHLSDITEVHLNQVENGAERKVAFSDSNKDLHLCPYGKKEIIKITGICESFLWNAKFDVLAATSDERFLVWYSPATVFIDNDILELCKHSRDSTQIGHLSQIVSFTNSVVTIRRKDGALVSESVSPYPFILYELCSKLKWEKAIKLCRYVKEPMLWACLATAALLGR